MSPDMIKQVVKATEVKNNNEEVVESIKPAYITELEEDLSADMNDLGGAKDSMAARMFDELKDDEVTVAASHIEHPTELAQKEEGGEEAELPDALKGVLDSADAPNPNISLSTGEENEDTEEEKVITVLQSPNAPVDEGDGMGPAEPQMTIDGEGDAAQ